MDNLLEQPRTALIAGSTGLIGKHCLNNLISFEQYSKIISLSRKPPDIKSEKLVEYILDFERLNDFKEVFKCDDVFLCLGTTMKKAGTKEKFFKIDYHYSIAAAKLALERGARQLILVSSLGANPESKIFYAKTKGELERDIIKLGFETVHILRPSLLLGRRDELRAGEKISEWLMNIFGVLFFGRLNRYRPIRAVTVADTMVKAALSGRRGINIFESDEIKKIAVADKKLP